MSAIGTAKLKYAGRSGDNQRRYKSVWLVWCDSAADGPINAQTAPGVPIKYTHYNTGAEYDIYALCLEKSSKQLGKTADGRWVWEVTCDYSVPSSDPEKQNNDPESDPREWPLEIEIDGEEYEDHPTKDWAGRDYVNSAGEPFPAEVAATPKNYAVITITKNQDADPLPIIRDFQNTCNNAAFYGFPIGTLKLAKIRARWEYKNGYGYWKTTYVFQYKEPDLIFSETTWDTVVLDVGEYYWTPDASETSGYRKVLAGSKDQAAKTPVKLDPTGRPDGYAGQLAEGATVLTKRFQKFDLRDFNQLNL